LRCWVEPIRLVAPLRMMPTVRVAMEHSAGGQEQV
jgi:hypothetical protein